MPPLFRLVLSFLEIDIKLQVNPFTSNGDEGHVLSSNSPLTSSASMIGYSIKGPSGKTLYLRMLRARFL